LSPLVEDDPEMRAALAASVEVKNDLEELAKWPHLRAGGGR
jgi:hypothetical protein